MKKRTKIIYACILILLGIVLIISGFISQRSELTKEQQKDKTLSEEEKQVKKNKYYADIEETIMYSNNYLIEKYPIKDFDKLNENDKTLFLIKVASSNPRPELTKKNLLKEKDNYFSEKTALSFETIKSENKKVLYEYDQKKEIFILKNHATPRLFIIQTKELSTKIYSDKWVTKKRMYYTQMTLTEQMYPQKVYKSIEDATKKQNEIYTITDAAHPFNEEEYKKVEDQLEIVTYTLKKDRNKYLLSSIEINKNSSSKN